MEANTWSGQAKRMQNGSMFDSFCVEVKKNCKTGAPYLSVSRRLIRPSVSEACQTREEGFTWGMQQSITVQQWGWSQKRLLMLLPDLKFKEISHWNEPGMNIEHRGKIASRIGAALFTVAGALELKWHMIFHQRSRQFAKCPFLYLTVSPLFQCRTSSGNQFFFIRY